MNKHCLANIWSCAKKCSSLRSETQSPWRDECKGWARRLNVFENDKQNLLVKQCLSWWPNPQACLTSKIWNVKPRPNGQTLCGKQLQFCLSNTMSVWPLHKNVLGKHFCLWEAKEFKTLTNKMYLSSNVCHGGQTHNHDWQAKFEMFDKKRLPVFRGFSATNACSFG